MICLLGGKTGSDGSSCTNNAWRPYLDLEYNECYSVTNKWNALFNGEMKYIFNAYFPNGQCVGQLCHTLPTESICSRTLMRSFARTSLLRGVPQPHP